MENKETILELRKRAEQELFLLFGVPKAEITESKIMFMVGLYQTNVDVMELAISMMQEDWEKVHPSMPGNDVEEDSEETRCQKKWDRGRIR